MMFDRLRRLWAAKGNTEVEGEQTGPQTITLSYYGGRLTYSLPATHATYRLIRAHPTVALTRAMVVAPVVAANWGIEADDDVGDDIVTEIRGQFMPLRESLVKAAMGFGRVDFGWQPYEKVFAVQNGRIVLRKVKPLLHDITTILIDEQTGAFNGFIQTPLSGIERKLELKYSLNIPFDEEGTNWYGRGLLENARLTYNKWLDADKGAARYDQKIAGEHWIVWYPRGSEEVNGVKVANSVAAADILKALESSGGITIPQALVKHIDRLNEANSGWRIELLSSEKQQHSFVDREKYLDALLVRALLMPERGVLEGSFGTKAEATAHQNLALTNAELAHNYITRMVNWHAVDQVVALNWGEGMRGKVRLTASAIVDEQAAFFRDLYLALLADPTGLAQELDYIDTDAIKDELGVPKVAEIDRDDSSPPLEGVDVRNRLGKLVRELFEEQVPTNGD